MNNSSVPESLLLDQAREAAETAYCPYSNFHVGSAVETDRGVFSGCNIENASYGLAVCAERVAIFSALASGAKQFHRMAVCCRDAAPDAPTSARMPCGACRQVIAEFFPPDAEVIVDGAGVWRVDQLLPNAFHLTRGDAENE